MQQNECDWTTHKFGKLKKTKDLIEDLLSFFSLNVGYLHFFKEIVYDDLNDDIKGNFLLIEENWL